MHGIIIATDGLWDELKKNEIGPIFSKNYENHERFLRDLIDESIKQAAMKNSIKKNDLELMELKVRRRYHDDISIAFIRFD